MEEEVQEKVRSEAYSAVHQEQEGDVEDHSAVEVGSTVSVLDGQEADHLADHLGDPVEDQAEDHDHETDPEEAHASDTSPDHPDFSADNAPAEALPY